MAAGLKIASQLARARCRTAPIAFGRAPGLVTAVVLMLQICAPDAFAQSTMQIAQTTGQSACPPGYRGRYPNCVPPRTPPKRKCRAGYIGKPPVCIRIKVQPKKPCPSGYRGTQPNCRRIATPPKRCKRGTYGKWPNCKQRPGKPKVKTAKPKKPVRNRKVRKKPSKRIQRAKVAQGKPANTIRRPNEIVVVLDRSVDQNAAFSIAQQYRLVRVEGRDVNLLNARVQRYRIPDRRSIEEVLEEMQGDARIRRSQPNYLYRLLGSGAANGNKKTIPAKAKLQFSLNKLNIAQSHVLATGRDIRIAVIDSGVDSKHPEFANSRAETYNAVRHKPFRADAHGTSVAGIISAGSDLVGIAPAAQLLTIRAFTRETRGAKPLTDTFVLIHALDWAHTKRARIYNLSFAGPPDPLIEEMVATLNAAGAIVIAAAGNGGSKANAAYPAAYQGVIAVTATDKRDRLYKKANRGDYVSIAAPGVGVFAPVPDAGYDFRTGTSFATPHVSGLVALMLERQPTLSAAQISAALASTSHDLGTPGPDAKFGAGRIDALAVLQRVIAGTSSAISRNSMVPADQTQKTGSQ